MPGKFIIACDMGGTNVSSSIHDTHGNQIGSVHTLPTLAFSTELHTLNSLRGVISSALSEVGVSDTSEVVAVGFAGKGPLDSKRGILKAESLPSLMNFDLGKFIKREYGAQLFLENNANCFALAETLRGAGKGLDNTIGINLGTGFGCGVVLNRKIYSGVTGNAGELEWCLYKNKKYDDVLSGRGAVEFYDEYVDTTLDAQTMAKLARDGEESAISAWNKYGEALGLALGKFAAIIDPSMIILGGSGAKQFDLFGDSMHKLLRKQIAHEAAESIVVSTATLGRTAGLVGAALHAAGHI